jgi:hypothetical protein
MVQALGVLWSGLFCDVHTVRRWADARASEGPDPNAQHALGNLLQLDRSTARPWLQPVDAHALHLTSPAENGSRRRGRARNAGYLPTKLWIA